MPKIQINIVIRTLGLANDACAFSFKSDTSTYKLTKTIPLENGPAKESRKCGTTYAIRIQRSFSSKKGAIIMINALEVALFVII